MPNAPWRNHFVPRFLLQPWANSDGKIASYAKLPNGKVTLSWRSPKSVGYDIDLYTFPQLGELATSLETGLFGRLDDAAARVVQKMIVTQDQLTASEMDWWSFFLLSLVIRGPESINALKSVSAMLWQAPDHTSEAEYQNNRGHDDPPTLEAWLQKEAASNAAGRERLGHQIIRSLTLHRNIAAYLKQMQWFVVTTDETQPPLLISDRPLFSSNGLKKRDGQLLLPLGPHALFCAFHDKRFADEIKAQPAEHIVRSVRQLTSVRAHRYVFGSTAYEHDYLRDWLGYERVPTMGETLAQNWRERGLTVAREDAEYGDDD